jgi:hypothetical protein
MTDPRIIGVAMQPVLDGFYLLTLWLLLIGLHPRLGLLSATAESPRSLLRIARPGPQPSTDALKSAQNPVTPTDLSERMGHAEAQVLSTLAA